MSTQNAVAVQPQQPGTVARQEFGADQVARTAETAGMAVAAQAQAVVQARYVMALQRPRNLDDVRMKVLREVERPGFAQIAWFRKPIGKGVEGLSVRFAETAARCMGNIMEEAPVVYEDGAKRIVRITVTDLEANLTKFKDVVIEKTVERRSLDDGRVATSVRKNSRGELTYTVPATEDELLAKEAAISSKVRRNLLLQVLPGDIQDAARTRIIEIRAGDVAKDPDGARRKVLDAFAGLNVAPSDLARYLGHDVATATPAEIQELRDLFSSIREGEMTWHDAHAAKTGQAPEAAEPAKKEGLAGLTDKLKAEAGKPCVHPDVPPSSIKPGETATCKACGEVLGAPRESGSDAESAPKGKGQQRLAEK